MKEQILEILNKNKEAGYGYEFMHQSKFNPIAEEITAHIMEFIEWAIHKEEAMYSGIYEEIQTRDVGSFQSYDELYQYWLTNFKKAEK